MKVMDLLNKIANGEEIPTKIKVDKDTYEWDWLDNYYSGTNGDDLLELSAKYSEVVLLNMDVELTEENQDIDIQSIEELDVQENQFNTYNKTLKINELIQAIKQLDRQINNN